MITYCPSCAAKIGEDLPAGEPIKCPVCGTEFQTGSAGESAERTIVQSDRVAQSSELSPTPVRRLSTEEILLERLEQEPPLKTPIRWTGFALLLAVIVAIS